MPITFSFFKCHVPRFFPANRPLLGRRQRHQSLIESDMILLRKSNIGKSVEAFPAADNIFNMDALVKKSWRRSLHSVADAM
jgi:hypothetical protein